MGFSQSFRCCSCGVGATVSGGEDVGMTAKTQTRFCAQCETLVDVYIGEPWGDESLLKHPNYGKCEHCNSTTEIVWVAGEPCPKCGGEIEATGEEFVNWD